MLTDTGNRLRPVRRNPWVNTSRWVTAQDGAASPPHAGVLLTFPLSHYCEKARWALDHAGMTFRERGYAPGIHKAAVGRHGASSAPVLVGERTLRESTDIVCRADESCRAEDALYPSGDARREIDALVVRLDETLGVPARLWFYSWVLRDPARLEQWASVGLGRRQRRLLHTHAAWLATEIAGRLDITAGTRADAAARIDDVLGMVSSRLADGRPYLAGDRFGAADLTFAALSGPILAAPGYGGGRFVLPPMPAEVAPQAEVWRATPAGRHALALYREHRLRR